jgi:hypothetical protein
LTDAVDFFLYGECVQTRERKAKKNANSSVEHKESFTKRFLDLFRRALDRCRVRNASVRGHGLTGPNGTDFLGGVITNGENEIHTWRCGSRKFFPWLAAQFRGRKFGKFQLPERAGMYCAFRLAPGTIGCEV